MDRRRRRKRKKEVAGKDAPATSVDELSDDLLRLILLRLDAPLWLIRAASACMQWRRAVAGADDGAAFLRLARSLHPPTVVGRYLRNGGSVTFVHSSPRPLPPPVSDRFSLDFLPIDLSEWKVVDCHGGLVLLVELALQHLVPSLIVCNPLTRRYQGVNPPPEKQSGCFFADAFLLDGEDGGAISVSNFRVLYRFNDHDDPLVCVFSTADDGDWRVLLRSAEDLDVDCFGHLAGRVDGSLYLGLGTGSVIVLDNTSLEFSKVNLPIRVKKCAFYGYRYRSTFRVVHGGAGDSSSTSASPSPTSRIVHVYGEEVEVFRRVHDNGVGGEWVLERSICRLSCYLEKSMEWPAAGVIADGIGFFILSVKDPSGMSMFFSVNVETMKLAVVPEMTYRETLTTYTCSVPWPSFMRTCLLERRAGRVSKG